MPTLLKTKKADTILRWASCVLLAACASIFLLSLIRYSLKPVFLDIAPYPIAAVVLCWLVRGEYKARPVYWLGAAFVVWFGVTRLLIKDTYGRQVFYYYAEIAIIYLFAFPFARAVGERVRLRVFDWLALATVTVITAVGLFGLAVMVSGQPFSFGGERFYTEMIENRLWILALNPNIAAMFMVISLLLTVYLMLRHRRRWMLVVGALALVIDYLTLVATDSRTAKISLLVCVLVSAAVLASRLFKRRFFARPVAIAGMAAAAVLICYVGFSLGAQFLNGVTTLHAQREAAAVSISEEGPETETSESAAEEIAPVTEVAERDLVDGYANGRHVIYNCFRSYLEDHPSVLLTGANNFTIRLMSCYGMGNNSYYMKIHLHNAFFQTLAETGVPGLALILAICVFLLIYSLRILFSPKRSAAEKMLPVLLLVLIVDSLAESPLFVPYDEATNSFFNLFFFLVAGYVVELGRKTGGTEPPHNAIGEQN